MTPKTKIIAADLDWIKKQLKPENSYIVFENSSKLAGDSIFTKELKVYEYLKNGKHNWQQFKDEKLSREYLVIQMIPGKEDETLGKLLSYGLPKDTAYYLYKAEER